MNALLNARIKLQKRHLLEWDALTANQRVVLSLIEDKYVAKIQLANSNILALVILKNQKSEQLKKEMGEQKESREQMRTRQKQEETLLNRASE